VVIPAQLMATQLNSTVADCRRQLKLQWHINDSSKNSCKK